MTLSSVESVGAISFRFLCCPLINGYILFFLKVYLYLWPFTFDMNFKLPICRI